MFGTGHAGAPRARRSNVQFDVEESPIIGEGSLKSTSWARKSTSNRSTFDVERSPDLKPSDHAGVVMEADVKYKEEQASPHSQLLLLSACLSLTPYTRWIKQLLRLCRASRLCQDVSAGRHV